MRFPNVLFLDLDGVLNREDGNHSSDHIDVDMVASLNKVIKATGVKVVITSTWRASMSKDDIQSHLNKFGFIGDIIGMTDDNAKSRFAQISDWMDDNGADDFVILDDIDVFKGLRHIGAFVRMANNHFFQTDKLVGLTDDIANKMIARLNNN